MFLTFFYDKQMASAVAMMIGGAVVNALAFTGSNFLFSKLGKNNDAEAERERHDKAVEQIHVLTIISWYHHCIKDFVYFANLKFISVLCATLFSN